ncbi:MAG: SurA N-terminal domain-containing protein [Nanoarchaeota archaeon]|nr:SurA N-terminal domain-containing protein [Nanoarchaeota archaeon]
MKIQQKLVVFFSLFFVVLVAGCSAPQDPIETIQNNEEVENPADTVSSNIEDTTQIDNNQQDQLDLGEVVARVNGDEILVQDVVGFQQTMMMQGQQISEDQALNQVIGERLLLQEVQSSGIEVSDEEAEQVIEAQLAMQGSSLDEYREQIESQGLSFNQEFQQIKESLAVQAYIDTLLEEQEFEVTQEDVQAYYEQARLQMGDELPPLEEVEQEIVQLIESEFQQEVINQRIQELQQSADIEFS